MSFFPSGAFLLKSPQNIIKAATTLNKEFNPRNQVRVDLSLPSLVLLDSNKNSTTQVRIIGLSSVS